MRCFSLLYALLLAWATPLAADSSAGGGVCLHDRGLHRAWRLEADAGHPERPWHALPADAASCPPAKTPPADLPLADKPSGQGGNASGSGYPHDRTSASELLRAGARVRVLWQRGPGNRIEVTAVVVHGGRVGESAEVRLPVTGQLLRGRVTESGGVTITETQP